MEEAVFYLCIRNKSVKRLGLLSCGHLSTKRLIICITSSDIGKEGCNFFLFSFSFLLFGVRYNTSCYGKGFGNSPCTRELLISCFYNMEEQYLWRLWNIVVVAGICLNFHFVLCMCSSILFVSTPDK